MVKKEKILKNDAQKYFEQDDLHKELFKVLGQKTLVEYEMKKLYDEWKKELEVTENEYDILRMKTIYAKSKSEDPNLSDEENKKYYQQYEHNYRMFKDLQRHIALIEELLVLLKIDNQAK